MSNHFNSGIQCLALIARFHQIPAEPSALLREFQHNDESLADINLIRAAKSLGFKAKFIKDSAEKLSEHTLPAIGRHPDGHFFIIAKISNDEVLIHDLTKNKSNNKPTTHTFDELTSFWTGDLLLLSKRSSLISGVMTESAKFGFSWFIPALVKYKTYFSDVFVAVTLVLVSSLTACSSIERIRSESLFEQYCNEEGRVGQFIYERVALGKEFFRPIPKALGHVDFGYFINDRKLLIDKEVFSQVYERNGLKKTILSDVGPIYSIETTIVRKSDGKTLSKAVSLLNMLGQTRGKHPIYGVYCRQGLDVKGIYLHSKEHSNLIDKTFSSNL